MYEYKLELCSKLKAEYYVKCIKTLYNWSFATDENILNYLKNLGITEYKTEILSLLQNKARINSKIDFLLSFLLDFTGDNTDRINALNELKMILLVCNKNQAIRIYSIVARTAKDVSKELSILETF